MGPFYDSDLPRFKENRPITFIRLFGLNLRMARKKAGLTQAEMSSRVGISQAGLNKYERARSKISILSIFKWCDACDLKPSEFWKEVERQREFLDGNGYIVCLDRFLPMGHSLPLQMYADGIYSEVEI